MEFIIDIKFPACTEVEQRVMPKGFAVLCYPVRSELLPEHSSFIYELFYGEKAKGNKELTLSQAMSLIKIHELELVVNNSDGKVWE